MIRVRVRVRVTCQAIAGNDNNDLQDFSDYSTCHLK